MTRMRRSDQSTEYDGRSISENLRDLDSQARSGGRVRVHQFTGYYTEPMAIGGARFRLQPIAILLARIVAKNSPEIPVADVGSLVHYVWDARQGARVTKIQGLTANSDTEYEFTFLMIYQGSA